MPKSGMYASSSNSSLVGSECQRLKLANQWKMHHKESMTSAGHTLNGCFWLKRGVTGVDSASAREKVCVRKWSLWSEWRQWRTVYVGVKMCLRRRLLGEWVDASVDRSRVMLQWARVSDCLAQKCVALREEEWQQEQQEQKRQQQQQQQSRPHLKSGETGRKRGKGNCQTMEQQRDGLHADQTEEGGAEALAEDETSSTTITHSPSTGPLAAHNHRLHIAWPRNFHSLCLSFFSSTVW